MCVLVQGSVVVLSGSIKHSTTHESTFISSAVNLRFLVELLIEFKQIVFALHSLSHNLSLCPIIVII